MARPMALRRRAALVASCWALAGGLVVAVAAGRAWSVSPGRGARGRARSAQSTALRWGRPLGHATALQAASQAAPDLDPAQLVGRWWNETAEFFVALEIWEATPLREDRDPVAVELQAHIDRLNSTANRLQAERARGLNGAQARAGDEEVGLMMQALPGLLLAYYKMRIGRTLGKRAVKKGLSSSVVYANLAFFAVFFRVVAPRLLTASSMDDIFDAAATMGIPDRTTLMGMVDVMQAYDAGAKIGAYILLFVVEKLTMVSEFLPLQIGLKTLAPIVFGGLVQGALASAACETLGSCCNFFIGRAFLTERLKTFSIFGSPALGEVRWYGALMRAAEFDGFRLVLLLRLAPVLPLPFDSYWYLLGALPVSFPAFAAAHFLGCLKTAFLDASFGVLLLTAVSPDNAMVQSQAQQVLFGETLALGIVAVLVSTVATRLINELLGLEEEETDTTRKELAAAPVVTAISAQVAAAGVPQNPGAARRVD